MSIKNIKRWELLPYYHFRDARKGVPNLNSDQKNPPVQSKITIENLSQAIFIVNRHAKTAINPGFLYKLKHESLKKLIAEGKAKKVGLHFSEHPKNSRQQSDVLVECGRYTFHIPPTKQDFTELPHEIHEIHRVTAPELA